MRTWRASYRPRLMRESPRIRVRCILGEKGATRMRRALLSCLLLLGLASGLASAATYTVDPAGNGDFTTIPEAWVSATAYGCCDTVCVLPGTYVVGDGLWSSPLEITQCSPWLVSRDGAEATLVAGDGQAVAFKISQWTDSPWAYIAGFTFRDLGELIYREWDQWGHFYFRDNIVENCGGYYAVDASSCTWDSWICRNEIRNNPGSGIYIYHNSGLIADNDVHDNARDGIRGACCEEPVIQGNHVHHNGGAGISTGFYGSILDNLVECNAGVGICSANAGGARIVGNIVRGNEIGVKLPMNGILDFHNNDLYDNTAYDLDVTHAWSGELDATMNWWGTVDPAVISSHVFDCHDDPGTALCVDFEPWCTSPGCEPTAVEPSSWASIKAMFR
jgi:hypothetical protein